MILILWVLQLDAADSAGQAALPPPEEGAAEAPLAAAPALMTPRMRMAASQVGSQGVEPLMTRIAEAEALLVRYSKENERLANMNNRLQFKRQFVDTDYTGALQGLPPSHAGTVVCAPHGMCMSS